MGPSRREVEGRSRSFMREAHVDPVLQVCI